MQVAPYISERRRRRKRIRAYLFTAAGIVVLYGIFFIVQWAVLHSPIFRVDRVAVTGNSSVSADAVVALAEAAADPRGDVVRAALTSKNMLFWPDAVPQNYLSMIPQLADADVSKDFFSHTVTINVTERSPAGIWCYLPMPGNAQAPGAASSTGSSAASVSLAATSVDAGTPCFWFDNTGTMFERAGETQGALVYTVYDTAERQRGIGEKVLADDFLPNFISIMDVLRASGLGVRGIVIDDLSLEEADVVTVNGPTIHFSLQFPADEYLPVIKKLMLQPGFSKLRYIDCTTENRVYYK